MTFGEVKVGDLIIIEAGDWTSSSSALLVLETKPVWSTKVALTCLDVWRKSGTVHRTLVSRDVFFRGEAVPPRGWTVLRIANDD